MASRSVSVIAVAAGLAVSGCAGERIGMIAPAPEEVRSQPAEAYPDINIVPDRPGRPRSPEEVAEVIRELEGQRARHAE